MWMHNGNIGGWKQIKRRAADSISERWFLGVQGGTDSEWAFAIFLDTLEKMGLDPDSQSLNLSGFGHNNLRSAMLDTIRRINTLIADISPDTPGFDEIDKRSLLNFAVADGHSVICTRYVSSKSDEAASLYFSSGSSWSQKKTGTEKGYRMERRDKGADIVLVASEPLTFERDNWVTVPTNSILTIHKQMVMIHPIHDEFYNTSPSYSRSKGFAELKGLVSTGLDTH
ncbi:MAG: hypothetical protein M1814_003102 [Vezdaea aestivalis]|nr:MAG: hypothetical protein M1814_003102 [Vezdaea aestivalis]